YQPQRRDLDALGPSGEVGVEKKRRHRGLVTLRMKVMLGGRKDVEAGLVGEDGELAQLVQHLLIALVIPPDRPQTLSLIEGRRHRWEHEKHEFHQVPPPITVGWLCEGRDSRCSGSDGPAPFRRRNRSAGEPGRRISAPRSRR